MKIVNLKTFKGAHIYCGRPSPLGNPFKIGRDGTRAEVIEKYRQWLWQRIQADDGADVRIALRSLDDDSILGCWCAPLPCHCEVIERASRWIKARP